MSWIAYARPSTTDAATADRIASHAAGCRRPGTPPRRTTSVTTRAGARIAAGYIHQYSVGTYAATSV